MRPLVLAVVLALVATGRAAAAPADAPTEGSPEGELGQALRDYFVHLLGEDLGLTETEAQALAPLVRELLDARRDANRQRFAVISRLRSAAQAADEAACRTALDRAAAEEASLAERVDSRRANVLARLTPRQDVRFLAFEDTFRRRVREMVARGRRGGGGDAAPADPRARPGRTASAARGPRAEARDAELAKTIGLWFLHEMRQQVGVPDDTLLALLPSVDALVATRLNLQREQSELLAELRAAAADASRSDADLAALVDRARATEADGVARLAGARRAVTDQLAPVPAAAFTAFEHRFWPEARRRARLLAVPRSPGGDAPPEGLLAPGWPGSGRPAPR